MSQFMESMWQFIEVLKNFAQAYYPLVTLVTTVIGFVLGLRTGFWTRVARKIRDFWRTDVRALKAEKAALADKLKRVHDAFEDDNNIWLRQPVIKPDRYNASLQSSIPIL